MLDMDDPQDVIAAAGKYTVAINAASGQCTSATSKTALPLADTPATWSPLDNGGAGVRNWIVSHLNTAATTSAVNSDNTFVEAACGALDLGTTDQLNGLSINRVIQA